MFKRELAKELVDNSVLKRSAIAAECGVQPDTLTAYLSGFTKPSKAVAMHLARILQVGLSEIWSESDTRQAS